MDIIGSFLEKFKHIKDPKKDREQIANIISEIIEFEINESELDVLQKRIRVNVLPMLKTQIFIKKEVILRSINSKLPHLKIEEIN